MRILLDYRPALRQRTGVGEYVHELARTLAATASESEQLCLFSSSWKDRLEPGVVPGAETIDCRVPVAALNFAWHRLEWPPVEWLTRLSFDVVQTAHPLLMPSRRAARIVTVCDLDFLDHPERGAREIRRDYASLAADHAGRADRVITISRDTARGVETRLGVSPDRISICCPGAPDWPARGREPADGCILFLGTLDPRKNLDVLLDAYGRLLATVPAAGASASRTVPPLVLAGRHVGSSRGLLDRARRPPFAGHVELTGYVDPDQRLALYQRALVFVLPSHNEGFGLPVVEAMRVGVPVVAANRGALPEVGGPAARLFEPADSAALSMILNDILSNPSLRHAMREAGWRQAARYSWRETAACTRQAWQLARAARHHHG